MQLSHSALVPVLMTLIGTVTISGCQPVVPGTVAAQPMTIEQLLPDLAKTVIVPNYTALDQYVQQLDTAAKALQATPNASNLQAAKDAWRQARTAYEQTEGHLFGPAKTLELDPALDSWPVNHTDLDAILASATPLTQSFVSSQPSTVRGFHVVEYLLFGFSDVSKLSSRALTYLTALTGDMKASTGRLVQSWAATGDNFAGQYGKPNGGAFASAQGAMAETIGAMAEICDELANDKIEAPLAAKDPNLAESQFSDNSLVDFQNNLIGLQTMYQGRDPNGTGGIAALVAAKDPALDAAVRKQIRTAQQALAQVQGSFGTAITQHPDQLRAVQTAVRSLHDLLATNLQKSLLGTVSADRT